MSMMLIYLIALAVLMGMISDYLYDHVLERAKNPIMICYIGITLCVIALFSTLYALILLLEILVMLMQNT